MAAEFDGEIDVPKTAIQIMDDNVMRSGLAPPPFCFNESPRYLLTASSTELPAGTKGRSIAAHGGSYWTRTA
jgi:hypothetical protein